MKYAIEHQKTKDVITILCNGCSGPCWGYQSTGIPEDVIVFDTYDIAGASLLRRMAQNPHEFCRIIQVENAIWNVTYQTQNSITPQSVNCDSFQAAMDFVTTKLSDAKEIVIEKYITDEWRKI